VASTVERYANRYSDVIKQCLRLVKYDYRHWTRPVMHEKCTELLRQLPMKDLDVLEISAGQYWKTFEFKSFTEANYPEFDICEQKHVQQFDLIIADQVFEHLLWPYRAAQNIYAMLRPGGHFLVATPFLIRNHPIPYDCTRWTETGMKYFLAECGFTLEDVRTGSWGNLSCVKANLKPNRWARRGWFGSLRNDPNFPVTVWAFAKKS
jgi:SAM-dependent methyltransferase